MNRYTIYFEKKAILYDGIPSSTNIIYLFDTTTNETVPSNLLPDSMTIFDFCDELNREDRATTYEDDVYLDEIFGYAES